MSQVPGLDPDTARKLNILRGSLSLAAPTDRAPRPSSASSPPACSRCTRKGRATHNGKTITGDDAEALMGSLRNPAETQEVWQSWHENVPAGRCARTMRKMVEIANEGAKALGYADTGAMWRSQI